MKKVALFLLLVIISISAAPSYAHSGGTDGMGGHYNRATGEYHYHHGYPAHSHTDDICPYEHDDKTGQSSGDQKGFVQYAYSEGSVENPKEVKRHTTVGEILGNIFFGVLFVFLALFYLPFFIEGVRNEWEVISSMFRRKK